MLIRPQSKRKNNNSGDDIFLVLILNGTVTTKRKRGGGGRRRFLNRNYLKLRVFGEDPSLCEKTTFFNCVSLWCWRRETLRDHAVVLSFRCEMEGSNYLTTMISVLTEIILFLPKGDTPEYIIIIPPFRIAISSSSCSWARTQCVWSP